MLRPLSLFINSIHHLHVPVDCAVYTSEVSRIPIHFLLPIALKKKFSLSLCPSLFISFSSGSQSSSRCGQDPSAFGSTGLSDFIYTRQRRDVLLLFFACHFMKRRHRKAHGHSSQAFGVKSRSWITVNRMPYSKGRVVMVVIYFVIDNPNIPGG